MQWLPRSGKCVNKANCFQKPFKECVMLTPTLRSRSPTILSAEILADAVSGVPPLLLRFITAAEHHSMLHLNTTRKQHDSQTNMVQNTNRNINGPVRS